MEFIPAPFRCRAGSWRAACGAFAATAVTTGSAVAQATDTAATVLVTATRSDARLDELALHTTLITAEDIRHSPAQTLDQLLRGVGGLLVPGAPAFTTDPTGHNIKFRGMDKKVLVLLDGRPVLDPFFTTIQWFKLPLSAIERVEIVRGGGSAVWGNLAVGGVINIVSRRPSANDTAVAASVGTMATATATIEQGLVLAPGLGLQLGADGFRSDGYDNTPANLRVSYWPGRDTSSAHSGNLRAGLFYRPSADVDAFLRVGFHAQDEEIGSYDFGDNRQRNPDLQAGASWRLGSGWSVAASLFGQQVHFDKFNGAGCYAAAAYACGAPVSGSGATAAQQAAPVLQYASSHDIIDYRERGGSLLASVRVGGAVLRDVQVGLDLRRISGEDTQQTYRTPTATLPATLRVQRGNEGGGAQSFAGVFGQFRLQPAEALELALNARVDRFSSHDGRATQTNYTNVATPAPLPPTGGPVPDQTRTAFDPALLLRYALADAADLRAAAYKGFRAPGLNNLYRSFGSASITIANPLLQPETMTGTELGLDWHQPGLRLSATAFDARVRDVVATYAITAATPIPDAVKAICGPGYHGTPNTNCPGTVNFYSNGQDLRTRGVELDGAWSAARTLDLRAYATFTRTFYTRTATGDPTDTQLPLVPRKVLGGSLRWQTRPDWTQQVELRYNGDMTLSSLTQNPPLRQGGYTVIDLSTRWRVQPGIEFFAALTNVGDKAYTDGSASNPQSVSLAAPRALRLGVRARFS